MSLLSTKLSNRSIPVYMIRFIKHHISLPVSGGRDFINEEKTAVGIEDNLLGV